VVEVEVFVVVVLVRVVVVVLEVVVVVGFVVVVAEPTTAVVVVAVAIVEFLAADVDVFADMLDAREVIVSLSDMVVFGVVPSVLACIRVEVVVVSVGIDPVAESRTDPNAHTAMTPAMIQTHHFVYHGRFATFLSCISVSSSVVMITFCHDHMFFSTETLYDAIKFSKISA